MKAMAKARRSGRTAAGAFAEERDHQGDGEESERGDPGAEDPAVARARQQAATRTAAARRAGTGRARSRGSRKNARNRMSRIT